MSSSSFLVGLLLVLCLLFVSASAASSTASKLRANDLKVLNFALTLEHLEATYYNELIARFSEADFVAAGYPALTSTYFNLIAGHENAHVQLLTDTINELGGDPVTACGGYNYSALFPLVTLGDYIELAYIFESTGAAAYAGQIGNLADTNLIQASASIATVEARHSAFLATLIGDFPIGTPTLAGSFNQVYNGSTVAALVGPFLNSSQNCSDVVLPQTIVVLPSRRATSNQTVNNTNNASARQLYLNDITVLKFALNLEMLERAFYTQGINNFSNADFLNAGYARVDRNYIKVIKYHEKVHSAYLRLVIRELGEPAPKPCVYDFSQVTDVTTFLQLAAQLESTGTSAYIGSANRLYNPILREVAASIAEIEARHTALLNIIIGNNPFPNVTDTVLTPSQVETIASGFIVSCPRNQTFPQPLFLTVNGTNSTI